MKSKRTKFPKGWDADRVRRVLGRYEKQTDDEAVAEDEAAFARTSRTMMKVPVALVPRLRQLIAKYAAG